MIRGVCFIEDEDCVKNLSRKEAKVPGICVGFSRETESFLESWQCPPHHCQHTCKCCALGVQCFASLPSTGHSRFSNRRLLPSVLHSPFVADRILSHLGLSIWCCLFRS